MHIQQNSSGLCVCKRELVCIECYQFFPHHQGDDGEAGDPGPAGEPGIPVSHITFMPSSGLFKFILSFLRLLNLSRIVITFAGVSGSQRRCRRKGGFWSSRCSWPPWAQRNTRRRRTQRQPCQSLQISDILLLSCYQAGQSFSATYDAFLTHCFCLQGPIGFPGDAGPPGELGVKVRANVSIYCRILVFFVVVVDFFQSLFLHYIDLFRESMVHQDLKEIVEIPAKQ